MLESPLHNMNYLYNLVETSRMQLSPWRITLNAYIQLFENKYNPIYNTQTGRNIRAILEIYERLTRKYSKPEFNITECVIKHEKYQIVQKIIKQKPFCNLLHFTKPQLSQEQQKLLIIAPMAGHHATLLRTTVQDLLPYYDIYITDWIDASQVPIKFGKFDMDDFIDYTIEFFKFLSPNLHVMAVCQPTVPTLAATTIMEQEGSHNIPQSLILIGGPIDARQNPTQVNNFATSHNIEWFKNMVITTVPANYPGYMRQVYPGFLQLSGFLSMNLQRHINSHVDMFKYLLIEEDIKAENYKNFYDEYLSMMDLPAEFYIQTIKEVFQDFSLAKGKLVSRGRKINLKFIKNCRLLGIEGENDDIAAVGQTKAALNLCSGISETNKQYYLQKGVGHYGVFSGSKFRNQIVPVIRKFTSS